MLDINPIPKAKDILLDHWRKYKSSKVAGQLAEEQWKTKVVEQ